MTRTPRSTSTLWEAQAKLASTLKPSIFLGSMLPTLPKFGVDLASIGALGTFKPPPGLAMANWQTTELFRGLRQFQTILASQHRPYFEHLGKVLAEEKLLNSVGWLPHESLPWEQFGLATKDEISPLIERHYSEEWPTARAVFERQLETYTVDDEAKAAFREALNAHEAGLYRASTRTVFPEIERVARIELHAGNTKSFASQKELQDWVGELYPEDLAPSGRGGMELFRRLIDHLYVKVEKPEALQAMLGDPVPNRHAALHGLVSYSTMQNSINALVTGDFLFRVICAVKRDRAETQQENGG